MGGWVRAHARMAPKITQPNHQAARSTPELPAESNASAPRGATTDATRLRTPKDMATALRKQIETEDGEARKSEGGESEGGEGEGGKGEGCSEGMERRDGSACLLATRTAGW